MKYVPVRKTKKSAGADLMAAHDYVIPNGKAVMVDTGFMLPQNHLDDDIVFLLFNRSSNGKPSKLLLLTNSVGVLDEDYKETVKATFLNLSGKNQFIKRGDSVCQIVVAKHVTGEFFDALDVERTGGHGSTGR